MSPLALTPRVQAAIGVAVLAAGGGGAYYLSDGGTATRLAYSAQAQALTQAIEDLDPDDVQVQLKYRARMMLLLTLYELDLARTETTRAAMRARARMALYDMHEILSPFAQDDPRYRLVRQALWAIDDLLGPESDEP